jgi:hypothetical protein
VRSRASSFKWEYPLLSLRSSSSFLRLLVTSISPFIFPSITCFRRQFLRKMWPIQLAFRFRISCKICNFNIGHFPPLPPHVHIHFVVPPPGCGRSVTDFWGWGAHRAQLRYLDEVNDDIHVRGVPEGALNLNYTDYPDHGRYGDLSLQGKIPKAELRNRTRDLMASSQKFWPPSPEADHIGQYWNW